MPSVISIHKICRKDPNAGELSGIFHDPMEEIGKRASLKINWVEALLGRNRLSGPRASIDLEASDDPSPCFSSVSLPAIAVKIEGEAWSKQYRATIVVIHSKGEGNMVANPIPKA